MKRRGHKEGTRLTRRADLNYYRFRDLLISFIYLFIYLFTIYLRARWLGHTEGGKKTEGVPE
jgi:hypothetical protein